MMHVRHLNEHDAFRYRYFRLRALKKEPELMGQSLENEEALSFDHWISETTETQDKCIFGLFDQMRLVGILMARRHNDKDSSGKTAYWGYAYIRPEYRGGGYGKPLYLLREEWTRDKGFTRVVFNFGKKNSKSLKMHRAHGAKYTHKELVTLPNGEQEHWYWFEKDLPPRPVHMSPQVGEKRKLLAG